MKEGENKAGKNLCGIRISFSFPYKIIFVILLLSSNLAQLPFGVLASSTEKNGTTSSSSFDVDDFNFYMNRTLIARNRIKTDLFYWFPSWWSDILVFTEIDEEKLVNLSNGRVVVTNSSEEIKLDFILGQFILLNDPNHFHEICNKSSRPVHWLRYEPWRNSTFRWIRSEGKIDNLFQVIRVDQENKLSESEFFEDFSKAENNDDNQSQSLICISSSPGVSSSLFQGHVATKLAQLYPEKYILRMEAKGFFKQVEIFLEGNSTEKAIEKMLWGEGYGLEVEPNKRIEILLQDFEEVVGSIDEEFAFEVFNKIKSSFTSVRIWVTSEYSVELDSKFGILERKLNTLCYKLEALTDADQLGALTAFWSRNDLEVTPTKLEQFGKESLAALDSNIMDNALLTNMIAEVYENQALEYSRFNGTSALIPNLGMTSVAELYQNWVNKKFENYTISAANSNTKLTDKQLPEVHALLGIELLFPEEFDKLGYFFTLDVLEQILKVGIMKKSKGVKGPSLFPDRTLAEYFVARFVADKLTGKGDWALEELNKFNISEVLASKPEKVVTYCGSKKPVQPVHPGIGSSYNTAGDKTDSYQFTHLNIGYFLDYFLKEIPKPNNSTHWILNLNATGESQVTLYKLAHSSANANFWNIYNIFVNPNPNDHHQNISSDTFNDEFVCLAIKKSGLDFVKAALAQFELRRNNFTSDLQNNFLRLAVQRGDYSIVNFLIEEKGLRRIVETLNDETRQLLFDLAKGSKDDPPQVINEKIKVLQYLVSINRNLLEQQDDFGGSALHSRKAHAQLLIQLLNLGVDVLARDTFNSTILHLPWNHLSSSDYHSFLTSIPEQKLKRLVQLKDNAGKTPLLYLVEQMEPLPGTLQMFKEAGADFNANQGVEGSILGTAVANRRKVATLQKLIELGSDPKWKSHRGTSILHYAAEAAVVESVEYLIDQQGLDVNSEDNEGLTPLNYLITSGSQYITCLETGLALEKRGGRFKDMVNSDEQSLLHLTAKYEAFNTLQLLLRLGRSDVNGVDKDGNTPLHLLVKYNLYNKQHMSTSVSELLRYKADPNVRNKEGETPLQLALKYHLDSESFLLLKSKSEMEWTPEYAHLGLIAVMMGGKVNGFFNLVQELEGKGGDLTSKANFTRGESLLHIASRYGNEWAVSYLVEEKGADVNATSPPSSETPLIEAAKYVDKGVGLKLIKFLIDNGADVYAKEAGSQSTFLHSYLEGRSSKPSASQFHSLVKYLIRKKYSDLFDVVGGWDGVTPYQLVLAHGKFDRKTISLLEAAGVGEN